LRWSLATSSNSQQVLADVEVVRLDLALRGLDLPREQRISMTSPSFMPNELHQPS
jgi:hypothetical protein